MATTVNVEGIGQLVFPDGMSEQDMLGAIESNFPDWKEPQTHGATGDWSNTAGEQAMGRFAKGVTSGIAGPLESIGIASTALARKFGDPILQQEGRDYKVEDRPTYKIGKYLRRKTAENFPVDEDRPKTFLGDVLPEGAGSMVAFIGGGLAGKAAKAGGAATVASLGAGAGGAEAFDEAKKKGASDEDAFKVFAINAGLGTTESVPIGGWLARLNKASGNKLTRAIREGSEEAIQEIFQQYGSNLTAQKYFDPERSWDQGLAIGGAAGFTLGSLMSLVVSTIGGRRARGLQPAPQEQPQPPILDIDAELARLRQQPAQQEQNVTEQTITPQTAPVAEAKVAEEIKTQVEPQVLAQSNIGLLTPDQAVKANVDRGHYYVAVGQAFKDELISESDYLARSENDPDKWPKFVVGQDVYVTSQFRGPAKVTDVGYGWLEVIDASGTKSRQSNLVLYDLGEYYQRHPKLKADTAVVEPPGKVEIVPPAKPVPTPPPTKVEIPPKEAPPVAPPADIVKPARQTQELPFDIIQDIKQHAGGRLSLAYARTIQTGFKPEGVARTIFTSKGGRNLDDALDGLHRDGFFLNIQDEQQLLDAIQGVKSQRAAFRSEGTQQRKLMRRELDQRADFTDIAIKNKRAKKKKSDPIPVEELLTGSEFQIAGEKFVVKELIFNPETQDLLEVIAEDGKRFGVQRIGGKETLHADKGTFVQHEPSTEFLDPQEEAMLSSMLGMPVKQLKQPAVPPPPAPAAPLPKLRRGETQGDVFATQEEPLALVGENGKDFERIAREKEAAAKAKAEADAINKANQRPLLGAMVPGEASISLVDSQPTIDRALSIGGGDVALKALVPNVRIRYGPLPVGVPAEYQSGVITLNKPVIDFIATRWPQQAQTKINELFAEELTHAIADTVLTTYDYIRIGETMSEADRQEMFAERPEIANILNRVEQSRHLGGEFVAKRLLKENENARSIDTNSPFGQRVLAALQKLWNYLTTAMKRFTDRNTILEIALAKVRKAKADVLADKLPVFEQGDPLNAAAIKQAIASFTEKGDLRTMRVAQAGEVVASQPLVQQFVQETRATAAGPEKTVQATTLQERLVRDIAQRVLSQPIVRNQLVGPVDTLNLSIQMADGDFADLERIRRDTNATDEEVSAAGGHALDTLRQLDAAVQVFNGEYLKERELLVEQIAEYAEEELSAMDQRDVDGVLFKQFQALGRSILDQTADVAGLKALNEAQLHSATTIKVLKFLRETQVLAGLQMDDNRSIDDLLIYINKNITDSPARFPNYDGSTFHTQIVSAVGASMDAIRDVLRIVRLSEPLRTEIAQSQGIAAGSQYAQPFHKIRARVLGDIAKGNLASAFSLYETGLVEVGITLNETRDSAHFYARKLRQATINVQALDGAKAIIDKLNADPAFVRQKREVQEFNGIAAQTIETDIGTATEWYDNIDLAKPRIGVVWERTLVDRESNVKKARALTADYMAYIATPDAPGYDVARTAGMRRALKYLQYYTDPSQDLNLGRLGPSGMVKLADHIGSVFGHPQLIPKYSFIGATGPAYTHFNLTMVALSDVLERVVAIEKQYTGRRKQALKAAIRSHRGMSLPLYREIFNPLAASRQNFNDVHVLKVGDGIGNGYKVTKEDLAYLNVIRQWQNEMLQVVNNYGLHKFESVSRVFSGILLDGGKQVRLPYARGSDMVPRSFPEQLGNWVQAWTQADTPEKKMDFLNQHKTRFIISYIRGVGENDFEQSYAYRLPMKEVLRRMGDDPIKSFQDLAERITHLHNADRDNTPITVNEARDVMLGEINGFLSAGAKLLPKKVANEKAQLQIIGGDSEYNAERKQAVMPLGMYDFGVVTDADVAGAQRGAAWSFVNAHINAAKAFQVGLESDINQLKEDAAKFGTRTVQQQTRDEAAHGQRLYDWGQATRLKELLSNYLTQIEVAIDLSANPFMMDRPHQVLQNSVAKLIVTSLVAPPSPFVRNLAGGFAQIAAFNAEVRRLAFPGTSATGQMISGTFKELMFLLANEGNPATRKIRSFLESREGRVLTLGFSKWAIDMANERRYLHDYTAQIVGVNLNQKFWESTKGNWALWRTKGIASDVMPPKMRQWLNGVSLGIDTLANFIGHATVGYADSRINAAGVYLSEKAEREFEEIAMRWGDKRMPNGLYPDKALARRLFGLDYGTTTPATRIRDWFRNSGIGPIDQLMKGYFDRMKAWEAAGSQGQKPRLLTDPQFVQMVMANAEDANLATFRSRPPLFKQSKLHSTLGILFGYPFFLFRKLLSFTNVMNNQSFLRRHGENLPLALTIALLIALTATLGNEIASKWIKRELENKVTGFPTLTDAATLPQAAQAVMFATADAVPIIGSAFNMIMGTGYAKGFDLNSQFLMLNLASDVVKTSKEIYQTGSIGRPMVQFASRYTFPVNVIGSRLPLQSGLRDFTNARNILTMGARGTGLETKLRRPGSSIGSQNFSASTPFVNDAVNAIGNNDIEGFQKAYNALVAQKQRSGSLNPQSAALTALKARHPVASVFGTRPETDELDRVLANVPTDLSQRARSTIDRYDRALAGLPRRTTGLAGRRTRSTRAVDFRTRRVGRLRTPSLRLRKPKLRRISVS